MHDYDYYNLKYITVRRCYRECDDLAYFVRAVNFCEGLLKTGEDFLRF